DLTAIGIAMSVPGVVTTLAQTPAGALVDWIARKRVLVAVASLGLAVGCLVLVTSTALAAVVAAQGIIGLAAIVISPAIAAISVGLVGHRACAKRMGRNEAYSHGGAIVGASAVGVIGYWLASAGIFYFAAVTSVAAAIAAMVIRERDIAHALAREA